MSGKSQRGVRVHFWVFNCNNYSFKTPHIFYGRYQIMQIVETYFKVYFQINAAFKYDFITLFMLHYYISLKYSLKILTSANKLKESHFVFALKYAILQ